MTDILESFGLKPYVVQRQPLARFGSDVWENVSTFDTLEEARAALGQMPAYGKVRYRVAVARPYISYDPV